MDTLIEKAVKTALQAVEPFLQAESNTVYEDCKSRIQVTPPVMDTLLNDILNSERYAKILKEATETANADAKADGDSRRAVPAMHRPAPEQRSLAAVLPLDAPFQQCIARRQSSRWNCLGMTITSSGPVTPSSPSTQ